MPRARYPEISKYQQSTPLLTYPEPRLQILRRLTHTASNSQVGDPKLSFNRYAVRVTEEAVLIPFCFDSLQEWQILTEVMSWASWPQSRVNVIIIRGGCIHELRKGCIRGLDPLEGCISSCWLLPAHVELNQCQLVAVRECCCIPRNSVQRSPVT